MIEGHIRDQARLRLDGIDSIEPSPHTDLEDGDVCTLLNEHDERRQRTVFEIGQRYAVPHRLYSPESPDNVLVAGFHTADADSLVIAEHVRRGVATDCAPRAAQQAFQHRDRGTLAVGARDVQNGSRHLERETVEEFFDALEAEVDLMGRQRLQPRQPGREGRTSIIHGTGLLRGGGWSVFELRE